MKNKRLRIFTFLAVLTVGPGCLAAGQAPTDAAVARELQHLLRTDPAFKVEPFSSRFLEDLYKFMARVMRDPVMITVAVAILAGLFFLVRKCLPYLEHGALIRQFVPDAGETKAESQKDGFTAFYRQALDYSKTSDYRLALIALHKATVEYLSAKVMLLAPGKTYSNNDLKRRLQDHPTLAAPFALITHYAEIAGFSMREISQADFSRALEAFEQHFLQPIRNRGGQ